MSWNYRVVRRALDTRGNEDEKWWYGIHEVYYDAEGQPYAVSMDAMEPGGTTLDELRESMEMFRLAFARPVLDYDAIPAGVGGPPEDGAVEP